jgi:hypothetical protein
VFQRGALEENPASIRLTGEERAEFGATHEDQYIHVGSIENVYFREARRGSGIMKVHIGKILGKAILTRFHHRATQNR